MSHLPTERLAALADEAPAAEELAHLASCEVCARERAIYAGLLAGAGEEYSRIGTPLTTWDALRPRLVADGVIDAERAERLVSSGVRRSSARITSAWRAAAAVVLVAGGIAAGRLSTTIVPVIVANQDSAASRAATASIPTSLTFKSVEDARDARRRAQSIFQDASAYLAASDTSTYEEASPAAMRTRLAALDVVDEAMREAMHRAPADPVINGYYLTTLGQKEATIQQINALAPSSFRINNF